MPTQGYIMKMIEKWKFNRDIAKGEKVLHNLNKFWSRDNAVSIVMHYLTNQADLNSEQLNILSNMLGQAAHVKSRDE